MKLTMELDRTVYWRLYCRANEHGRSISEEIARILEAGSEPGTLNAEKRLADARAIRARAGTGYKS